MTRTVRFGWVVAGVVGVAALALGARAATGVLVSAAEDVPTGTPLRILTLLPSGTHVKKGDAVVTFDPTDQQKAVEEQRSVLREAQLEIARTEAAAAARQAQDELDLLTARFDLRKAELDVQASEVRPPLEARKAQLTLEEARNRLAQLEGDRTSRAE